MNSGATVREVHARLGRASPAAAYRCQHEFISKVNFYDNSGGLNRFFNIYTDMEKGLLSRERNDTSQFTEVVEAISGNTCKPQKRRSPSTAEMGGT